MCVDIIPQWTDLRICLIAQHTETHKASNTGLLATKALENSCMFVRGEKNTPLPYDQIFSDKYEHLLLFPSPGSSELSPELLSRFQKPIQLIVPDGNWGQASRMSRIFLKRRIQAVHLPTGFPTHYRLRRNPCRPEGTSTLESIAHAHQVLGYQDVASDLLDLFHKKQNLVLEIRGKSKETNLESVYF